MEMKRGQLKNIEIRPDVLPRRKKPCSKIEAKLRSRRCGKLENDEVNKSPRICRVKNNGRNSSSENEISPRFLTSKQHVELVNFEKKKILPWFTKIAKNFVNNCGSEENIEKEREKLWKNQSVRRSASELKKISKISINEDLGMNRNLTKVELGYLESSEKISEDLKYDKINSIEEFSKNDFEDSTVLGKIESKKKRSRSAPCNPLFKMKCSKDKFPRDLLVEGKSDKEIREKIRKFRKNAPIDLRISRSDEVSISSREKSSNEKLIEGEKSCEKEVEFDELIFSTKNAKFFLPEEKWNLSENLEKNETILGKFDFKENENKIDDETESKEERNDSKGNDEICEPNVEIVKIDENERLTCKVENEGENNITREEEVKIISPFKNFERREKSKIVSERKFSPRTFPRKREFKWETILEKQHREYGLKKPENRKESSDIVKEIANDKLKFLPEKSPKINENRKARNCFEKKNLEAYSVIKEELPKLLMKRTILEAQKNDISRKKIFLQKKTELNYKIVKNPQINSRISRIDSQSPERSSRQVEHGFPGKKKNSPYDNSNFQCCQILEQFASNKKSLEKTKKMRRASILKRRKSPSPRRVTFRLPGRFIEEKSSEEEINLSQNFNDEENQWETSKNRDWQIVQVSKYSPTSSEASFQEIYTNEPIRNFFRYKKKLREHDGLLSSCIEEKARRFRAKNSSENKDAFPIVPRFFTVEGENNFKESEDSEQDWETPTSEDIYGESRGLKFPKETREAMKILIRAKDNMRGDDFDNYYQKTMSDTRDVYRRREENPKVNNCSGQNFKSATSYAKALAKFQESCDRDYNPNFSGTTRQHRGSRNANVAVEIAANECRTRTKRGWQDFVENDETRKFRDIKSHRVNTRTMQSNGSEGGNSENGIDRTGWTVGLINGKFKYLTAETFGFKINANGASLKKKQLWTLEGSEHQVYLRSHLDRYLAVDQFGNVTCEAEDPSDPGCAFQIQLASDGSGRWALKNVQRGYFLGSSQDELKCMAKAPGEAEYWLVHLAARPQVNLRSAGRKRFAHLSASQDEIHVDAPVPWGEDTLFTLEFRAAATADNEAGPGHGHGGKAEGGHYALHTCNNKYLARDGKLLDSCTRECLYAAEFHAGLLALRDIHGAYLAPIGSKAVLKSRSTTVTRDELFSLEESLPQASFVAALNQRYVSVKQGVDVTANQDEISGHETFQLEFDRVTKRWYVRTMQDRYWSLEAGGGIQASDHKRSSNALFDLVWQPEDGTVALRANNGKFLATKRSGHLYANADSPDSDSDASKYYFYLMNRPILVLRCEQGFVGPKSAASPKLECNKAGYETIRVERCERGIVRFKGQNGKYWHADSEGVTVDSDLPSEGFYLELREPSRLCIKCTDGRYLTAGKNGALRLGETDHDSATKWEF